MTICFNRTGDIIINKLAITADSPFSEIYILIACTQHKKHVHRQ